MPASDFTFDGVNKHIIISSGITSVDVQDMYSRWKDWMLTSDNSKYLQAFRTFGGDATIAGQFAPRYYFLTNGWRILVDTNEDVSFGTNLYTEELEPAYIVGSGSSVSDRNSDAVIVRSEISESLDYAGVVNINPTIGVTGTSYPVGTLAQPVNNFTDAKIIAAVRGINEYKIFGTVALTGHLHNSIVHGGNPSDILVFQNAHIEGSTFKECLLNGYIEGGTMAAETCMLLDGFSGASGIFKDCGFGGKLYFYSGANATFSNCSSMVANESIQPSVFLNYDANIAIRKYAGGLNIYNCFSGSNVTISFEAGRCSILSGCTGGTIFVRGIASFTNQSSGTTVDISGLLIPQNIASQHTINVQTELIKNK